MITIFFIFTFIDALIMFCGWSLLKRFFLHGLVVEVLHFHIFSNSRTHTKSCWMILNGMLWIMSIRKILRLFDMSLLIGMVGTVLYQYAMICIPLSFKTICILTCVHTLHFSPNGDYNLVDSHGYRLLKILIVP